jgi:hypothetical protein
MHVRRVIAPFGEHHKLNVRLHQEETHKQASYFLTDEGNFPHRVSGTPCAQTNAVPDNY